MHDALAALLDRLAASYAPGVDESTRWHVEQSVAAAGADLLADWVTVAPASVVAAHTVDLALHFDARIGISHANHVHKLVESCAVRIALAGASCSCDQCARCCEPGGTTCFFRCAPCEFTLCEDCFSTSPPAPQASLSVDAGVFVSLLVRRLVVVNPSAFALLSPDIVVAATKRLRELPIHNAFAALPLIEIIVELFAIPGFPRLFVSTQPNEWLPQPILSTSVRMQSLVATLLACTSVPTSTAFLSFKPQWTTSYDALRRLHTRFFQLLLCPDAQPPFVVGATLACLATLLACLVAAQEAGDKVDGLDDGILVNMSVALTHLALPILASRRCSVQPAYHKSLLPRRVYPWRPDTLRVLTEDQEAALEKADRARLAHADTLHRSDVNTRDDVYLPVTDCHYRVMCEQCGEREFSGVRYKCAFCNDFDFCGPCYDAYAQQCQEPDSTPCHSRDHVFVRMASPVSVIGFLYIFAVEFSESKFQYASETSRDLVCTECGRDLEPFDEVFRCCNCLTCRLVCPSCLANEERDPYSNQAHVPGHTYMALPRQWRQRFDPRASALHFPQLVHPPCLFPPETFTVETDLVYLTIKTLHDGPMRVLSKLRTVVKEIEELQAFCACDEKRVAFEKRLNAQFSPHYAACRARLNELKKSRAAMELHVLDEANILDWLTFYSQTTHWILSLASSSHDAFQVIVHDFSTAFTTFPEHFFFDLCAFLVLLPTINTVHLDQVDVEPLLVLLTQLIASRSCSENPHLRVQAINALSAVVTTYMAAEVASTTLAQVLRRCAVLREAIVEAILQLHEDMEGYHVSNDGSLFADDVSPSQDRMLWGLVPIRVTVTLLLRALYQFDDQNLAIARAFNLWIGSSWCRDARLSYQVGHLIARLLTDAVKLLEEAEAKHSVLAQLADVRQKRQDGQRITLPFRPSMLEGYMALHSKQLRLSMRMLVEILELLSWMADATPLRPGLLRSELLEQLTRTLSFLISRLSHAWKCTSEPVAWHEQQDVRRAFAQLVVLVVRCASPRHLDSKGAPLNYWSLVQESGSSMLLFIGSLEFQARFALNEVVVRREMARYQPAEQVMDMSDANANSVWVEDEPDQELGPIELYSSLIASTAQDEAGPMRFSRVEESRRTARLLGLRFVLALASDGRFNQEAFSASCDMLRRSSCSSDVEYDCIDHAWITAFRDVLSRCGDALRAQSAIEDQLADAPTHFLDPLLNTLMLDPVRLPSGTVVDRSVIVSHVLTGSHTDPFTREHLTLDMLAPCHDLRQEIHSFVQLKLRVSPSKWPLVRSSTGSFEPA